METDKLVQSHNNFIILFFASVVIVQLFVLPFADFKFYWVFVLAGFIFTTILLFLNRLDERRHLTRLRTLILFGGNLYVFLLNILYPDIPFLLYLLFPIIFAFVYNHTRTTVILVSLTISQLALLYFLFHEFYLTIDHTRLVSHYVFLLLMVLILTVLFVFRVGPEWKRLFVENKRKEEQLTSKDGYLHLFFEHAQDAIAVFSLDLRIITVNPAFETMYGWKKGECQGKKIQLYPDSELRGVVQRNERVKQGESFHLRTKEMRKDRTLFDAEMTIAPIYNQQQEIIAISVIARDITDKLQAETLKMDAIKLKAIGEIAASVAHEVRNPMTAVSGFVQMMNDDPANPYRHFTEIMSEEIKRINLIASEFLIFSKPNIKKTGEFDIEQALLEVVNLFEDEFQMRKIKCPIHLAEHQSYIFGNEESVKQVFINLLRNALEALSDAGTLRIKNRIISDQLSIEISDNGSGMNSEALEQLFEPFYSTKEDSAGLGMVITKKIIYDHKGKIEVASNPGTGTVVTLTFPIAKMKPLAS
ncbi:ATP-binding protein [Sporosarcina sp. Te-1]|uniref:ATP-binding protein n=1 Tax=Sporosarcina sp. Te-1 TaxID=2818390 RepID=UPI001A9E28BD|nr:ATP-binding protein [Sporosarcina sp. Te-1]QTD42504.1 PAS domain S-box protein [Sporosarcina sp. Te-1]